MADKIESLFSQIISAALATTDQFSTVLLQDLKNPSLKASIRSLPETIPVPFNPYFSTIYINEPFFEKIQELFLDDMETASYFIMANKLMAVDPQGVVCL